jgi:hypothetical protein
MCRHLVPQPVVGLPFKNRLIDHFGAGRNIDSQAFEFFQQVSRSENAAPVADLGVKPTTTLTMQAVSGYAYFLATVTEPAPVRLLWHFPTVVDWLYTQLHGVIMGATEAQAISGNGVGTNQTGVLYQSGVTVQHQVTDTPTTIRSAITNCRTWANGSLVLRLTRPMPKTSTFCAGPPRMAGS